MVLRLGWDEVLSEGQAGAELAINDWLYRIDMLVQASIIDRDLTAPPGGESEGDVYLVAGTATGDWVGQEGKLAGFYNGGWLFMDVLEGFRFWVQDEGVLLVWNGSTFETVTTS